MWIAYKRKHDSRPIKDKDKLEDKRNDDKSKKSTMPLESL